MRLPRKKAVMPNFVRSPNGLKWSPKTKKMKFSEMGLPGVEKLNGPCGILLPLSRGSQLPYSEKSENCRRPIILNIFPIYSLLIPLRAAYGAQTPARNLPSLTLECPHFGVVPFHSYKTSNLTFRHISKYALNMYIDAYSSHIPCESLSS